MRARRWLGGGMAALSLGGCVVGPNFRVPAAPTADSYARAPLPLQTDASPGAGGAAQRFLADRDVPGQWWTLYQSPALNALVERALQANPDIASAQAALRAAREAWYAQRAAQLPTVDASYNVASQKISNALASPLSSNAESFTLHTAQLSIAYAPDVFGGLRRQTESAAAQAEAQRFTTEATYLTLTTNVVATAIQAAMLHDQIAATRASIRADRGVLDILRRQFSAGEIANGDVLAQEAVLAQAEQSLPPLEKQQAQALDLLADLTGQTPAQFAAEPITLSDLTLPAELPLSLPSKLVHQRPDVRAAEANLHAASAQVGVAIANRLPNIVLAPSVGGAASRLGELLSHDNGFWLLSGTVTQPIFDAGALKHRQRGAEAAYDQAAAQYRSTVLAALQNVADTLQAIKSDAAALKAAETNAHSAAEGLALARRERDLGQVGAAFVLNAEQTYQQALSGRAQAEAGRYADTAALFQALGGGWWNRSETQP